jgi:hypothetical protein
VRIDLANVFEKGAILLGVFPFWQCLNLLVARPKLRRLIAGVLVRGFASRSFRFDEGGSLQ